MLQKTKSRNIISLKTSEREVSDAKRMSRHRAPSIKSKYYLPKEEYLTVVHYALRYPALLSEYNVLADTAGAIRYDRDKVQTSVDYDSTFEAATKLAKIGEKLHKIENALELSAPNETMKKYLRQSVCDGLSEYQLIQQGMRCGHGMFSNMRGRFYYELAGMI